MTKFCEYNINLIAECMAFIILNIKSNMEKTYSRGNILDMMEKE